MNKIGIFNCPKVKKNDTVEVVYQCDNIKDENYYKRVIGKVIYVNSYYNILIELPQNFKKVGNIRGWKADKSEEEKYGCIKEKLYWWVSIYRKIEKKLEIE